MYAYPTFLSYIVMCLSIPEIVWSCKCRNMQPKEAYCAADWVSYLQVDGIAMPQDASGIPLKYYSVHHKRIFKAPPQFQGGNLSTQITTPEQSATCGLVLEAGKQYLVAGGASNDTLSTHSCGQIRGSETSGIVDEWQNIPEDLQTQLEQRSFEPC